MTQYTTKLTDQAMQQIEEIHTYIAQTLQVPDIARRWVEKLQAEIATLRTFPKRYPVMREEPWNREGVRKVSVDNYMMYYVVDEDTKTVWVTAVIYGRRNQLAALREMRK